MSEQTVRNHRNRDPEFGAAVEDAMGRYRAEVAKEIHRRAIVGWDEPLYQGGKLIGTRRKYSDSLLLAHAKRHMPEYGDRMKVEQVSTQVDLGLEKLSPESRDLLRRILEIEGSSSAP